jgi:hypothetical protein
MNKRKKTDYSKQLEEGAGMWYSACLECVRPWVRSQHQKRKKKGTKQLEEKQGSYLN